MNILQRLQRDHTVALEEMGETAQISTPDGAISEKIPLVSRNISALAEKDFAVSVSIKRIDACISISSLEKVGYPYKKNGIVDLNGHRLTFFDTNDAMEITETKPNRNFSTIEITLDVVGQRGGEKVPTGRVTL